MSTEFRDEIASVINRHSRENRSNTPDHLLAEFTLDALDAFDRVVNMRETWYGRYRDDIQGVPDEPLPDLELKDTTTIFDWNDDTPIYEAIGNAIGLASLCWSVPPEGLFDDARASKIVDELNLFIANRVLGVIQ